MKIMYTEAGSWCHIAEFQNKIDDGSYTVLDLPDDMTDEEIDTHFEKLFMALDMTLAAVFRAIGNAKASR
jgi:hypothetical protein